MKVGKTKEEGSLPETGLTADGEIQIPLMHVKTLLTTFKLYLQ